MAGIAFALLLFIALSCQAQVPQQVLTTRGEAQNPVQPAFLVEEADQPLSVRQALRAAEAGSLEQTGHTVISRGIGSRPAWLVFDVVNNTEDTLPRRLSIEIGWLESVNFYLVSGDKILQEATSGDRLPVDERTAGSQWPRIDARFPPGTTRVLVRVATADPLLAPLYMMPPAEAESHDQFSWLFHGFVYGAVFALMIYNFVLFLSLKYRRYLFYALYMLSFLAMNLSYTGLGMVFFWPDAVGWQQWAPILFMVAFGVSGLTFGTRFLEVKQHQPRLYRFIIGLCLLFSAAAPLAMALGQQSLASLTAFSFIPLFCLSMLYMGISALRRERRPALLFVLGTLASVIGALVSSLTVWGWLPYTRLGFRAVDVGMVIDASLLALALAEQVRLSQRARQNAEAEARIDPLTHLNNRRGFEVIASSLWASAERHARPLSLLMIDLDHFKAVNDLHGHPVGDALLRRIARLFEDCARESDVLARWGGEEFLILLPDTTPEEAILLAERLRTGVQRLDVPVGTTRVSVTISIGIARKTGGMTGPTDLLRAADHQLYRAKQAGRNRVCRD